VNLLQFLINFLGDLKDLKDACKKNGTKLINRNGNITNFKQIAIALQQKQRKVSNAISTWLDKNPKFVPNISKDTTISAASFRELIIKNRLYDLQMRLLRGKKARI
jgi:hypothetical protein